MRSVALLLLVIMLAACGGGVEKPTNIPANYHIVEGDRVALALPEGWLEMPVHAQDFAQRGADLRAENPQLAARMETMAQEIQADTLRFLAYSADGVANVNIAVGSVPPFESVKNEAAATRQGLEKAGYDILQTKSLQFNDRAVEYTLAKITVQYAGYQPVNWMLVQYTLISGGTSYSISFGVPDYALGRYEDTFEQIARTFHTVK